MTDAAHARSGPSAPPSSPLFLTPPHLQQREIGLGQRPRFGSTIPVRILRRAKALRLRSSIYRAFVYAPSSEAALSLLPFCAPPARRHLVCPRPTPHCSKLREKEPESPGGRSVGAPWLPLSCCLGDSRGKGVGGSRTACPRQPSGGAELRVGPCASLPGSPGALAAGCARSCWAGTGGRPRNPPGPRVPSHAAGASALCGRGPSQQLPLGEASVDSDALRPPRRDPSSQPSRWRRAWPLRPGGPAPAARTTPSGSSSLPVSEVTRDVRDAVGRASALPGPRGWKGRLRLPGDRAVACWKAGSCPGAAPHSLWVHPRGRAPGWRPAVPGGAQGDWGWR